MRIRREGDRPKTAEDSPIEAPHYKLWHTFNRLLKAAFDFSGCVRFCDYFFFHPNTHTHTEAL